MAPTKFSHAGLERLRETANRNKPWLSSTGPVSVEGKQRCSKNHLKHGLRSQSIVDDRRRTVATLRLCSFLIKYFGSISHLAQADKAERYARKAIHYATRLVGLGDVDGLGADTLAFFGRGTDT